MGGIVYHLPSDVFVQRLSCLSVGRIMLWEKENFDVFTILAAVILS